MAATISDSLKREARRLPQLSWQCNLAKFAAGNASGKVRPKTRGVQFKKSVKQQKNHIFRFLI